MHGRERADPAIVARKPANKAGQPAAEPVERRAGAEGNADQPSTRRAQGRVSVSQALDRVRQTCRQLPKVGAVCGNAARTVLCGGRPVMGVPTAIPSVFEIDSLLSKIEPLARLTDALERMVSGRTKAHEIERLLPWDWKAERLVNI